VDARPSTGVTGEQRSNRGGKLACRFEVRRIGVTKA